MSLRARLGLALAGVIVVLAISGAAILQLVHASLNDGVDRQLKAAITLVADLNDAPGPPIDPTPAGPQPASGSRGTPRLSELFIGQYTSTGTLTPFLTPDLGSPDTPQVSEAAARAHASKPTTPHPFDATTADGSHGFRVVTVNADGRLLLLAFPTDRVSRTYRRVQIGILVGGLALLSTLLVAGWWVERLGLRPIKAVTDAAAAIATGDLDHRVSSPSSRTEAGRLGEAFNVMVDQRQSSEQRLRQFVADASHELRTPLATIAGVLELHHSNALHGPALADGLDRAQQEASRMTGLVNDLLELVDLDRGRTLDAVCVDLGRLATDAAYDASMTYPHRNVLTNIDDNARVVGDEARLRQVVANLVDNALSHTDPTSDIRIRVRRDGSTCLLEVEDEGPGIDPAHSTHIFERFYRGDPGRARSRGGSGLGLSIVKSIVEAHHGSITLSTAVNRGSTFRIRLPAHTAERRL